MKTIGGWSLELELALKIKSSRSRKPDIEHDAARRVRPLACQKGLRGLEQEHVQSDRPEEIGQCSPNRGIIVYDEDERLLFRVRLLCHAKALDRPASTWGGAGCGGVPGPLHTLAGAERSHKTLPSS